MKANMGPMFDYDSGAPLDIEEISVQCRRGVKVQDISYANSLGGRVTAYLVTPPGKGPFAGMLFLHDIPADRSQFMSEAVMLAQTGVMSLLIDAPFRRPAPWRRFPKLTQPEKDFDTCIQLVIDLRRGVDLLTSRAEVDANRIGYVGHGYGASWGGVLAGVETRIQAYVLMAGLPTHTDFWCSANPLAVAFFQKSLTEKQQKRYLEMISAFDPIHYIGYASPSALFFQIARQDGLIPRHATWLYQKAASEPKLVKCYDSGHNLNTQASRDRVKWLQAQLGIGTAFPSPEVFATPSTESTIAMCVKMR